MSGCIIGNLYECEQAHSARSVSNSALENLCMIIIIPACIRTSLDSYFCLISLALNVRSRVRIYYDSLYVHIRLLIVFVFLFLSEYMQYCSAKFVTDCRCIFPSLGPCFSLSEHLY